MFQRVDAAAGGDLLKKAVLKNYAKFTEQYLCWSFFLKATLLGRFLCLGQNAGICCYDVSGGRQLIMVRLAKLFVSLMVMHLGNS